MQTATKIKRQGFRKAPADVKAGAERTVAAFIEGTGTARVFAELRPASYCGPDSAGARGAYVLALNTDGRHSLHVIERSA